MLAWLKFVYVRSACADCSIRHAVCNSEPNTRALLRSLEVGQHRPWVTSKLHLTGRIQTIRVSCFYFGCFFCSFEIKYHGNYTILYRQ